jgi:cytoplasmic iron level regulating protein YaaA (DUF328/UPF0246 family)
MAPNPKRKASRTNSDLGGKSTSGGGAGARTGAFLMILSPAKTLNLAPMERDLPIPWTSPTCSDENTKEVMAIMKTHAKNSTKLSKLLGISASLTETAKTYWDEMTEEDNPQDNKSTSNPNRKPCGFAFSGAAYQGLQMDTLSKPALEYLQNSLRIVDPLYGWLRPMDVIQPYRLEMATKTLFSDTDAPKLKLADYWKPAIQTSIENEAVTKITTTTTPTILNLASDEYSAAVDAPMIKLVFRQDGRVLAVHAKRARGLMCRYLAEQNVSSLEQIQDFSEEGYSYQPNDSDDETTLVFDRPKNWKKPKTTK